MAGFGVLIKFRFHYIHLSRGTVLNWSALAFRFIAKTPYARHCRKKDVGRNYHPTSQTIIK